MNEIRLDLNGHSLECIIGVWAEEKKTPQRVGLDLSLRFSADSAVHSDNLGDTVNYAQLLDTSGFILQKGRFSLLETAASMIWRYLMLGSVFGRRTPTVNYASVTLHKYDALSGTAVPTITIAGDKTNLTYEKEEHEWGTVDIIQENEHLGLYRLNLAPGKTLPLHHHKVMNESECILDPGLSLIMPDKESRPLPVGECFTWQHDTVHGYINTGGEWSSILCIDSPPFIPSDEVLWQSETR